MPRPGGRVQAVARHHDEDAALGRRPRKQLEHGQVRLPSQLGSAQELRGLDDGIGQDRLVVEEQPDRIEVVPS